MDYNLHKSNSTYFSDMDVARTHLVTAFLRDGINKVGKRPGEENVSWKLSSGAATRKEETKGGATIATLSASGVETAGKGADTPVRVPSTRAMTEQEFIEISRQPGNLLVALGSVAGFFHREIVPYKQYEIWTRLLTWDRKWMYMVSYFVEAGTFHPEEFVLQPWRKGRKSKSKAREGGGGGGETLEQQRQRMRGKVYATMIATYVIKKGRLTIPPEIVLQKSGMLPARPPGAPSAAFFTPPAEAPSSRTPENEATSSEASATSLPAAESVASLLEESLFPETASSDDEAWTWEKADKERRRGLRFAQAFDGLNVLRDEFDAGNGSVLGVFGDSLGIF
jgi:hypothetical protein